MDAEQDEASELSVLSSPPLSESIPATSETLATTLINNPDSATVTPSEPFSAVPFSSKSVIYSTSTGAASLPAAVESTQPSEAHASFPHTSGPTYGWNSIVSSILSTSPTLQPAVSTPKVVTSGSEHLAPVVSSSNTLTSLAAPPNGATPPLPSSGPPTPLSPVPFEVSLMAASSRNSSMSWQESIPIGTSDKVSYVPSSDCTSSLTPALAPSQATSFAPTFPTSGAPIPFTLSSEEAAGSYSPKRNVRSLENPVLPGSSSSQRQPELKTGVQTSLLPGSSAHSESCDVYIGFHGTDPSLIRYAKWMHAELELHGVGCFSSDRALCSDQPSHDIARRTMDSATIGVVLVSRSVFKNSYSIEELTTFLDHKNLVPVFFDVSPSDCQVSHIIEKQGETWEVHGGEHWKEYSGDEKGWSAAVEGLLSIDDWRVEAHEGNWRESILKVAKLVGSRLGSTTPADRENIRGEQVFTEEFPCSRNASFVGREKELKALEKMLFFEGNSPPVTQSLARINDPTEGESAFSEGEEIAARSKSKGSNASEISDEAVDGHGHPAGRRRSDSEIEREREVNRGRDLLSRRGARSSRPTQRERRSYGRSRSEIEALSKVRNQVCIIGLPGIGKSELALEFAYRNMQKYQMVLWVGGEARYLRPNYLNLCTVLGVDVGSDNEVGPEKGRVRTFDAQEADAIQRIRSELQKDIPYLLIIDNLEIERDWWDGRDLTELLPQGGSATHVLITTRLPRVMYLETVEVSYLSSFDALALMRGGTMKGKERSFSVRQIDKFKDLEEKLRRLPLGLAVVGKLISGAGMKPSDILAQMGKLDSKQVSPDGEEEAAVLLRNPFLVKLFDVCFNLMGDGSGRTHLATRMALVGGWCAPAPCPLPLLGLASQKLEKELGGLKSWGTCLTSMLSYCMSPEQNARRIEGDAGSVLVKYGIARLSTRQDCLLFHEIIKVYCRKRGGVPAARCFVRAVRKAGSVVDHYQHFWSAAFLVCRFASDPIVVEFRVADLLLFTRRLVLPLALRSFNTFSRCMAALEILRLSYVMLENVDKSFVSQTQDRWDRSLWWRRNSTDGDQVDEYIWQDLTLLKASVLETRAKLMMRGGQYDGGEELFRTCIDIRTVMLGADHPDTKSAQETLSKLVHDRNHM